MGWNAALFARAAMLTLSFVRTSDAFLSGAPNMGNANNKDSKNNNSPVKKAEVVVEPRPSRIKDLETDVSSCCEVLYVGDAVVRGKSSGLCFHAGLTAPQAQAIAVEAAESRTVPKSTLTDALSCLAHASQSRADDSGPILAADMDGVWRLCFSSADDFLPGINVDKHGYIDRMQQVDVSFDSTRGEFVMGTRGLDDVVPEIMKGPLSYSADKATTVAGTFDSEMVDMEPMVLQVCLAAQGALGFRSVSKEGKNGFLLFRSETSTAAALNLQRAPSVSLAKLAAKKAAGDAIAGKSKIKIPAKLREQLLNEQGHEDKRLDVEEQGKRVGGLNSWMRYLETEGGALYAVIAGPVIFSFWKAYTPIATAKVAAAALVIGEVLSNVDVQA